MLLHYCMLSYRPEAKEYVELSCQHIGVFYRSSNGAGYRPGCMIFRIHHAEIFSDLEAYSCERCCILLSAEFPG